MYWTKEIPVKEGYYWVKIGSVPSIVWYEKGYLTFFNDGMLYKPSEMCGARWYGPLDPPERESSES